MDAKELLAEFVATLLGQAVTHTRLAANTLLLYVGCAPGDGHGFVISLAPPWHVSAEEGVLVGSYQAGLAAQEGAPEGELDQVATPLHRLLGQPISAVDIDPRSRDVTLTIAGQYLVRTFVDQPGEDDTWHIRDFGRNLVLQASPDRFMVRTPRPRRGTWAAPQEGSPDGAP